MDEVVITINGEKRWLWRAVDRDGYVLDEIVQARREAKASKDLLTRLLRKQGCRSIAPRVCGGHSDIDVSQVISSF
jgi:transposase-like protein